MRTNWTQEEIETARTLRAAGQTSSQISDVVGRPAPSVRRVLNSSPANKQDLPAERIVMGRIRSAIAVIGQASPGRHHVGHITDIHHGSKHSDAKALLDSISHAVSSGCEAIICTGDTLDGCGPKLLNEQRAVGFDDQVSEAVEVWSASAARKAKVPIIAISGNHDSYFNDAVGIEAGRVLSERMQAAGVDWRYIGSCMGRAIVGGARCVLYHPHGGGATRNAVRRVLNAKAEAYEDHDRPDIIFGGHFHKFAVVDAYPERVLCVGGGTFQLRNSDFGVRMIHPWDTGHGIVSWTIAKDGRCHEKSAEFYPVRTEARGWNA